MIGVSVPRSMSMHPRTSARGWLNETTSTTSTAPRHARPSDPLVRERTVPTELVPTSEETRRLHGELVHRMTRAETEAWNTADPSDRDEARRAIREAVREQGGGELLDYRGRLVERVD